MQVIQRGSRALGVLLRLYQDRVLFSGLIVVLLLLTSQARPV